jgi:TolA-binding protein
MPAQRFGERQAQAQIDTLQKQLSVAQSRIAELDAQRAQAQIALNKAQSQANQSSSTWQANVNWSLSDTGAVDCPSSYGRNEHCLDSGGRSCLMRLAIQAALHGDDSTALQLTLITQCHNPAAASTINDAGARAVGNYLRAIAKTQAPSSK